MPDLARSTANFECSVNTTDWLRFYIPLNTRIGNFRYILPADALAWH